MQLNNRRPFGANTDGFCGGTSLKEEVGTIKEEDK